jgi:hypothetical protein
MPTPRRHKDPAARQRAYRERCKLAPKAPGQGLSRNPTMPAASRWKQLRKQAETDLQTLIREMEEHRDKRSDAWLEGKRGQAFQERLDLIQEAADILRDID